ncbi:MAG: fimbrial protein, partial [Rikenellaceae bacterium]
MKQLRHISLLTFLALLIASCNKESIDANSPQQGAASITIALSETALSRADVVGEPNENHINELKIFIFDATTTTLEKVVKIDPKNPTLGDDKWNNTTKTLVIKDLPNPTLSRTVYVIANWITDDAKLAAITNEAMLLEQFTELTGQIATPTEALPLVMSGKATHTFSTQKALTVSVKRQVAKIKLTVSIDSKFADKFSTTTFGNLGSEHAKVELRNAPNRSYVCEQAVPSLPAGSKMLRYTPVAMTQTGTTSADMSWTTTFYVYENIANGADNQMATYLSLQMPYQDGTNAVKTDNYYKFSINTSDITNPHVTLRNKFYNMSAKVMGFGDAVATPANAEVFTEVLDWNGISVDAGALGDDYVVFQSTDIPTTTIPSGGGLYKLKCKSKLGRWGVKVTNNDGVVVGGSVADVDATSGFGETLASSG